MHLEKTLKSIQTVNSWATRYINSKMTMIKFQILKNNILINRNRKLSRISNHIELWYKKILQEMLKILSKISLKTNMKFSQII